MDYASFVESVRDETGTLNAALAGGPIAAGVPTCEGWTVADLASHVGSFCGFWSHVLCEGTGRPKTPFAEPPSDDGLIPWVADLSGHLIDELTATPPGTEVWTWFDADQTAGFVGRRCAHELSVHRYDAQSARGATSPISADLAADGIDELLTVLVTTRDRSGDGTGRALRLDFADLSAGWVVTLRSDRIAVERQVAGAGDAAVTSAAQADLTLTGTASDLELLLLRRPPLGSVDFRGDETVLDDWYREFAF